MAILEHPNICPVYGMEEIDGHSFIVMQYVEGDTLAALLRRQRPDPARALAYAEQIVSAVAEAHAHGIIHRDIKPQNIVVTAGGRVKVLDFGLAKTIQLKQGRAANDSSRVSQGGLVVGTVAYMSPEQLRAERLDFRSDIFSVGTVLYELFLGENPFARESDAETISAILTHDPPHARDSSRARSGPVNIILKCLEKDRERRYQSASEVLYELGLFAQGPAAGVSARAPFTFRIAVACALIFLLVASSVFLYRRASRPHMLAVLPISNEVADAGSEYLRDGLADGIINKLSRLPGLRVKPLTAVSGYRSAQVDPLRAGRELGVDAVLSGRLVRQGGSLILQTTLVSTADGAQLWGERYDAGAGSIPALQETVAGSVASALGLSLGDRGRRLLAARETNDDAAYQDYIRGMYFWANRNKENVQKAVESFNSAIARDPAYARAWAGLADCYALMSTTAYGNMPTEEAMNRSREAARRALEIDETLPEAHVALGVVKLKFDWDWAGAEAEFKRAIALNPDSAPAHYWYSNLLTVTGRQAEALAESELAKNLDPFALSARMNYCREFYYGRQYDRAATCLKSILDEQPGYVGALHVLGFVHLQQGLNEEAVAVFERLPDTNRQLKAVALAHAHGRAGRKTEALKLLAEVEELSRRGYVPPHELAVIYLGLGDRDQAFAWLNKACDERFAVMIYLTVDPAFDILRPDPRFADLARCVNLAPPPTS